jgi:nucleoside-diphosphate-sugar epimerase
MVRDDFPALKDYNDHLEFVTDVVFDMTYGSDEEKAAAETRAKLFYEKHKAKIDENWVVRNPLQLATAAAAASGTATPAPEQKGVPVRMEIPLILPQAEGPVNILTTDAEVAEAARRQYEQEREEHQRAAAIGKEAEMQYFENRRAHKAKLRKVGGFKPSYQVQRLYEEAFTDLFYFYRGDPGKDGVLQDSPRAAIESD